MAIIPNATVDGERVEAYYIERPSYYQAAGEAVPAEAYEYADMFHVTYADGSEEYVSEEDIDTDDDMV